MSRAPLEAFREWYLNQPEEVQDMVAVQTLVRIPRFDSGDFDILLRPKDTFLAYLGNVSTRPSESVAEVLLIRAIVDFAVMRHFGQADWELKEDQNREIADDLEREHGPNPMSDKLRNLIKDFPHRKQLWFQSSNTWRVLKGGELADEFLEAWEHENRADLD
jgi:hypothetical protein